MSIWAKKVLLVQMRICCLKILREQVVIKNAALYKAAFLFYA
jgi:hypothetical protein